MKISMAVLAVVAAVSGAAFAQGYGSFATMDKYEWSRFEHHIQDLQARLNNSVQSGQISPYNAWQIQREFDAAHIHAINQHAYPNTYDSYDVRDHIRHVHSQLGGRWDREFEPR